jgi:hypothetical protein
MMMMRMMMMMMMSPIRLLMECERRRCRHIVNTLNRVTIDGVSCHLIDRCRHNY